MYYVRFSEGKTNYKLLPIEEDIQDHIKSREKDYYVSIYRYNEEQYNRWKENRTVAGIKDVTTDKLVLDFDSKDNIDLARQDTIAAVSRMVSKGVPVESIQLAFSGQKGFSVELLTDKIFTVDEFKSITNALAGDLPTFDKVVSDPQRIVRVACTKHEKSGLYKFPLSFNQLCELPIEEIKRQAADLENVDEELFSSYTRVKLPDMVDNLKIKEPVKEKKVIGVGDLDLSLKPRWLSPAKYALQEGFFKEGERSTAFMILASTYKNQGFNKGAVYRLLKATAEAQSVRNTCDRFPDDEIWNNVIEVVFGPNWMGGQYGADYPLLVKVAEELGLEQEKVDNLIVEVKDLHTEFLDYAKNFEQNIVKTGIPSLDANVMFMASTHNGLLGQPGSGKTGLTLQWLEYVSSINSSGIFYSLDMAKPLVYSTLIRRAANVPLRKAMEIFNGDSKRAAEIANQIDERYKNIRFNFKAGSSPESIKDDIKRHEDKTGIKTKLLIVDYLECLAGPFSDATANTAVISNQMKDLASELGLCSVMLLQTQKHGGDISDPITSMKRIKGASVIEQSSSVVLSLWREGYDPATIEQDKYMSFAAVKNRFGPLWQDDFYFHGQSGQIREIDETGRENLAELKKDKAERKLRESKENTF